jgi:hypothetical protein
MKDIKYSKNVLRLQLITLGMMLLALAASSQTKSDEISPTILTAFALPEGYQRTNVDAYSEWLINHPLKDEIEVEYYDGGIKPNYNVYAAVFKYDIGKRNLHQCADAAIYLRASYNYSAGLTHRLEYTFTSGYQSSYLEYLEGARIRLLNNGTNVQTIQGKPRINNNSTFRKWLDQVWSYAGTYSVEKFDTEGVNIWNMKPGDIFAEGGFPGHIVTVVDMAKNKEGHQVYMLAQSYMPAQENQILVNQATGGVWYSLDDMHYINTPEYTFEVDQLRRFKK